MVEWDVVALVPLRLRIPIPIRSAGPAGGRAVGDLSNEKNPGCLGCIGDYTT